MQGLTILLFICNFYLLIIFKTGIQKNVLSNPSKRPHFSILRDSSVTERINRKKNRAKPNEISTIPSFIPFGGNMKDKYYLKVYKCLFIIHKYYKVYKCFFIIYK